MKTWELIKALQEGKYISHPDYEDGRLVRLKDINSTELVFDDGVYAGMLLASLNYGPSSSFLHLGVSMAEEWKIEEDKSEE